MNVFLGESDPFWDPFVEKKKTFNIQDDDALLLARPTTGPIRQQSQDIFFELAPLDKQLTSPLPSPVSSMNNFSQSFPISISIHPVKTQVKADPTPVFTTPFTMDEPTLSQQKQPSTSLPVHDTISTTNTTPTLSNTAPNTAASTRTRRPRRNLKNKKTNLNNNNSNNTSGTDSPDEAASNKKGGKKSKKKPKRKASSALGVDAQTPQENDTTTQPKAPKDKRERNKISASNYRKRRKMYFESLDEKFIKSEATIEEQKIEIRNLQSSNQNLQNELSFFQKLFAKYGYNNEEMRAEAEGIGFPSCLSRSSSDNSLGSSSMTLDNSGSGSSDLSSGVSSPIFGPSDVSFNPLARNGMVLFAFACLFVLSPMHITPKHQGKAYTSDGRALSSPPITQSHFTHTDLVSDLTAQLTAADSQDLYVDLSSTDSSISSLHNTGHNDATYYTLRPEYYFANTANGMGGDKALNSDGGSTEAESLKRRFGSNPNDRGLAVPGSDLFQQQHRNGNEKNILRLSEAEESWFSLEVLLRNTEGWPTLHKVIQYAQDISQTISSTLTYSNQEDNNNTSVSDPALRKLLLGERDGSAKDRTSVRDDVEDETNRNKRD